MFNNFPKKNVLLNIESVCFIYIETSLKFYFSHVTIDTRIQVNLK